MAATTLTLGKSDLTDLAKNLRNNSIVFRDVSDKLFTPEQKTEILDAFFKELPVGTTITTAQRGFFNFLLWLANNGGSEMAGSDRFIIVRTTAPGGVDENLAVKYNTIVDTFERIKGYTHHRLLCSFADYVSELLSFSNHMTMWGKKNGIPTTYLKFSFPGAEHCENISDEALKALSFARAVALTRAQADVYSDHWTAQSSAPQLQV
jgi:hypothetical protein